MKLSSAIETGLNGITTLSVLGETLQKMNGNGSAANRLGGKKFKKRFKKAGSKKPTKAAKQYIQLAGDLLGSTGFLGISALGKKKHAALRGALLGTAAGLGVVLLNDKQGDDSVIGYNGHRHTTLAKDTTLSKALQVSLFTVGGLLAGRLMQGGKKKKKK